MPKQLTAKIQDQIDRKALKSEYTFNINSVDRSSFLTSWDISNDRSFGSASATFVLKNNSGVFGDGGANEIKVGNIIDFIDNYGSDSTEWQSFFGQVDQRSINNTGNNRTITLICLDYISVLQNWDVDLEVEGTKVQVENEILTPSFLPSPNEEWAQVFDFANDAIATNPVPVLIIRDRVNVTDDPQFDGFDILYSEGQVKLGAPLQALNNFNLVAKSYYHYVQGVKAEDALQQLLTTENGYGGFLFDEDTAADVITNHLTTTFNAEEGINIDTLTPNLASTTYTIKTTLTQDYDPDASGDEATKIHVTSTSGLPSSGQGEINGDIFTWSSIGSGGTTLEGIPTSGSNALKEHTSDSVVKYEATYTIGQLWYHKYSKISTTLTASDYTIPGGTFKHFDGTGNQNGAVLILESGISILTNVTSNTDYSFSTLQNTGIELNKITFRSREIKNRFDAIRKLLEYVPPNYIVRTQGDNKIWATYLEQKTNPDYTLNLPTRLNYLEDENLFTRVVFYAKNNNPTNLLFNEEAGFTSTDQGFDATANNVELVFSQTVNGWHEYITTISGAGKIELDTIKPILFLNGVPIDNTNRLQVQQPILQEVISRTETNTKGGGLGKGPVKTTVAVYTSYKLYFPHQNIDPNQTISLIDATGIEILTIAPNSGSMDYARGIYVYNDGTPNSIIASISTATYNVFYSTDLVEIDYDNIIFRISNQLIPNPNEVKVQATFEYWTIFTPLQDGGAIIDGRWDTHMQTEFFAEPPSSFPFAIIDLGSLKNVQAMDIIAGFYKPDENRKFDIDMRLTLRSSTDNVTYNDISDNTSNFQLSGGAAISFEEEDFGVNFQTRYIMIVIENVKKVEFGNGVWPVAFTDVAIYDNIILKSDATLIATTQLTQSVSPSDITINVESTEGFTEPESGGDIQTAYVDGNSFTYTGLTTLTFTGVTVSSGSTGAIGDRVSQTLETDSTLFDDTGLLPNLGDRTFKEIRIDEQTLFSQSELDNLAKQFSREFVKNNNKIQANVMFQPFLKMGQTVELTDTYNNHSAVNYFIDGVKNDNGNFSLVLARYPSS